MRPANVLILFVRYPEPGRVKTRLARSIGDEAAARLYRALVENALSRTRNDRLYARAVFYTPEKRGREIAALFPAEGLEFRVQEGEDLGKRMIAAFDFAFSRGARKTVVIGTDVPLLDAEIVNRAFAALDAAPCVIGPSRDGGYYLIGLGEPNAALFRGVEWGTTTVLERTREIARRLGLHCAFIDELFDIDDLNGLRELKGVLESAVRPGDPALRRLAGIIEDVAGE